MAMQAAPGPKKEWFLYLMLEGLICRLKIDEFCKNYSPKPQFEVVHDFNPKGNYIPDTTLPYGMQPIILGSKVYMLGGEILRAIDDDYREQRRVPNLDVFAIDPDALEGRPTISLTDGRDIPRRIFDPRLIDPRTLLGPIVFTLENKIYVMARGPYSGDEEDIDHQPTLFRVFDPLERFWKELPRPPHCDYGNDRPCCGFCNWGHYILAGSNLFDTHQEKWEELPREKEDELALGTSVEEFDGFLVGADHSRIGVYKLDENGMPKLCRELHELKGIFCPFLLVCKCVIGKCDGGRMWLAYTGKGIMGTCCTRVAVFRVSIEVDLDDNPVISAELEAAEFYDFPSRRGDAKLSSAFSMCHHSNNGDIEEKKLCGTIIEHDHPRG